MRNPLRSEAAAFRFVWWTIGFFAPIVLASAIDRRAGLVVFVLLGALVLLHAFRRT